MNYKQKIMSIKRTSLENYLLLLQHFEKMRNTPFKPKSFLKSIQPFCKTEQLNLKILFVRVRGSVSGITIEIKNDCFLVYQDRLIHEFIFYCNPKETSSKTLLSKLLKHKLLIS